MKSGPKCLCVALLLSALAALPARAESPAAAGDARREAAERFDRGLRLFNLGENAGALVEFRRAYDLTGDPLILLNVGLVYAEMKRPVDAVEALDRVLAVQAQLPPERRETAQRVRAEQWASVAFLAITTDTPAVIAVDDVEVARTPFAAPLRVASGSHVVSAVATGYAPSRKQVEIAGGESQKVAFSLVRSEASLGHAGIHSLLPAADVLMDGKVVGRTPMSVTLAVAPGTHQFELRRPGYRPATRVVTIDEGATADVTLEADLDVAAVAAIGGTLVVQATEPGTSVVIDGRPTATSAAPLVLAPGPHRVTVARAGFLDVERDVAVQQGATTTIDVTLEPTAETKDAYVTHARARRAWALGTAGVGVVAAAAGAVLAVTGRRDLADANQAFAQIQPEFQPGSGQLCDPKMQPDKSCDGIWSAASQRVSDAELRTRIGYAVAGVGAVAIGIGVALLVTGDNPGRYDHAPVARAALAGWASGTGGGLTIVGRF